MLLIRFVRWSYDEAIASYDQALKINPNDGDAFYNKACCYGLQGQVDLAIANLKQAIELNPKYCEIAKTNSDFDRVRNDKQFQNLIY